MMMPSATGSDAVAWVWVLVRSESLIRIVLRPSMPAIWLPVAVPVALVTSISPVE